MLMIPTKQSNGNFRKEPLPYCKCGRIHRTWRTYAQCRWPGIPIQGNPPAEGECWAVVNRCPPDGGRQGELVAELRTNAPAKAGAGSARLWSELPAPPLDGPVAPRLLGVMGGTGGRHGA